MSITHTIASTFNDGGSAQYSSVAITADNEAVDSISVAVAGGGTKKNFALNVVAIKSVWILVTGLAPGQTVVLTTYTELQGAQGSALDTLTLTNGVALQWQFGSGLTCPLQVVTAVNSLKVINTTPNTAAAQVDIKIAYNG